MVPESGSMFDRALMAAGAAFAAIHIFGRLRYPLHPVVMISKPLPIASLAILLSSWSKGIACEAGYTKWLRRGLTLSMVGDICLLPVAPFDRFIAGLAAFLAAHVCYIIAFCSEQSGFAKPAWLLKHSCSKEATAFASEHEAATKHAHRTSLTFAVPFVSFAVVMYGGCLHQHLPMELVGPVIAYVTAIGTMGWRSASRFGPAYLAVPQESYTDALCGSVLFMISDALLGLGKFNPSFATFTTWVDTGVMLTYYGGQYFIARSCTLGPSVTWGEDGRPIGVSRSIFRKSMSLKKQQ
jgi:uncharacterized membrane protein YhhN